MNSYVCEQNSPMIVTISRLIFVHRGQIFFCFIKFKMPFTFRVFNYPWPADRRWPYAVFSFVRFLWFSHKEHPQKNISIGLANANHVQIFGPFVVVWMQVVLLAQTGRVFIRRTTGHSGRIYKRGCRRWHKSTARSLIRSRTCTIARIPLSVSANGFREKPGNFVIDGDRFSVILILRISFACRIRWRGVRWGWDSS